jgi:hypothetical protein
MTPSPSSGDHARTGDPRYTFEAEIWLHQGGAWHFVSLPQDLADEIEAHVANPGSFGAVRVEVTLGATTWRTSIFPSTGHGTYVLPVKRAIRTAAGVGVGDRVRVELTPWP